MKTILEWIQEYTEAVVRQEPNPFARILLDVRREAFDMAELTAYRAGADAVARLIHNERVKQALQEKV